MGIFIRRKFSKQSAKLKSLLELAISRVAVARRPRLARKSIATGDGCQLLSLGHLDRALHRVRAYHLRARRQETRHGILQSSLTNAGVFLCAAEQVIKEDNMLEALGIIELYCKCLNEKAAQLDKPQECSEEIREAAAGIMFAARWCSDLPELQFTRKILADKFGDDLAAKAKEGTGLVDSVLAWKLSGETTRMELKKKVTKEIAAENNILVDFSQPL